MTARRKEKFITNLIESLSPPELDKNMKVSSLTYEEKNYLIRALFLIKWSLFPPSLNQCKGTSSLS
jgi:hypothetical protein